MTAPLILSLSKDTRRSRAGGNLAPISKPSCPFVAKPPGIPVL